MRKTSILYIFSDSSHIAAPYINAMRRCEAMRLAGVHVTSYAVPKHQVIKNFIQIARKIRSYNIVCFRIDGSCALDIYALIKCVWWWKEVVWEIHGFAEELLYFDLPHISQRDINTHNVIRKILSNLVNAYVFVSDSLKSFAHDKLSQKQSYVIPNFIPAHHNSSKKNKTLKKYRQNHTHIVWVGNASLPWHDITLIKQVATIIADYDSTIHFTLVSSQPWRHASGHKNISYRTSYSVEDIQQLISTASIGIAFYRISEIMPIYFSPMKLLDYMDAGLPVIATNCPGTRELITDKINGLLTDNDPREIVKQILYLQNHPSIAARYGRLSLEKIRKNHSLRSATKVYQRMYR